MEIIRSIRTQSDYSSGGVATLTDPDLDSPDGKPVRPQVAFSLPKTLVFVDLARQLARSGILYHDMMRFDDDRAVLRLTWDATEEEVNYAAAWLGTDPSITVRNRHYGRRLF